MSNNARHQLRLNAGLAERIWGLLRWVRNFSITYTDTSSSLHLAYDITVVNIWRRTLWNKWRCLQIKPYVTGFGVSLRFSHRGEPDNRSTLSLHNFIRQSARALHDRNCIFAHLLHFVRSTLTVLDSSELMKLEFAFDALTNGSVILLASRNICLLVCLNVNNVLKINVFVKTDKQICKDQQENSSNKLVKHYPHYDDVCKNYMPALVIVSDGLRHKSPN